MPFNDWTCPDCAHSNFEKRDKCRQCGCFRSKARGSTRSSVATSSGTSAASAASAASANPKFKQGDWFCSACGIMNFAARTACYKCKKEHAQPSTTDTENDTGRGKCIICWVKDPEVVFTKCGHFVACFDCLAAIEACPMCRVKFNTDRSDMLKVYTP